ncbi:MAG: hypothetical protein WCD89_16600 [Anaerocolumna sp.]
MAKKLTDKVTWVGKVDWELKKIHGQEYSTRKGSSYNSYLIRDKKTVLIDTVWQPYDKEFVTRLKQEIDLKEIDYIIANHRSLWVPDAAELSKCTEYGRQFVSHL